ncbi:MAG: hypothetical protein E7354_03430 [Clostridiales bacterium]|nr:hypothetical protein [Clostridiales bacterium]
MKKFFKNILLALLLIPICLGFFGCKDDEPPPGEPPAPVPPPTLSLTLDSITENIGLNNLSATVTGNADYTYTKKTNNVTVKSEEKGIDNFVLKADNGEFYLKTPNDSEHYFSNNILYSRDHIADNEYGNWTLTYNNALENIFAKDEGLNNLESFIEPIVTSIVENIELVNENWVSTRHLDNGGYGLDINIDLTSILNKTQTAIKNTYSASNEEKTLEHFINLLLAERYDNVTLESIITDLLGNDTTAKEPFIKDSTNIRQVLQHLDSEYGFNTYPIVNNLLRTYYLITSDTGTTTSAKMSASLILDTPVYTAMATIKSLLSDDNTVIESLTEEQVKNTVNEIVNKYLRSETYTVEYICEKLQPSINEILGKDIDLYSLITTAQIGKVAFNLSIETNANKNSISAIYGDMEISFGRDVVIDTHPAHNDYKLNADFDLTISDWGTTVVNMPTVTNEEGKTIKLVIIANTLSENSSYNDTLNIPYITEDIEIVDGEYTFRYKVDTHKLYFSPQITNALLGIENGEYVDNKETKITLSATISPTLTVSATIIYLPLII